MRFIELFAGIGGFRYGLEGVGWLQQTIQERQISKNTKEQRRMQNSRQFTCVWANEWKYDPYKKEKCWAWKIYQKHYGTKELDTRDITTIPAEIIPDHDFLTAGFPCPSYSIAGKRKGFKDPRGVVFFEICRIAKVKRPQLLLLENVKGLLNHDNGNTFRIILDSLSELGYDCEWEVLNSKNSGVPQNRERVFIIGHLRGTGGQKVFPIGESSQEIIELQGQQVGAITARRGTAKSDGDYIIEGNRKALQQITKNESQGYRVYDSKGISATLQGLAGGVGAKTGLYAIPVLTPNRIKKRQHGRRFKENGDSSFTLTGQDIHGVSDGINIRRLTPTECERLQGFPDGWTEGISDTQRYKCLGNAVTTNVVTEIGKRIAKVQQRIF